MKSFIIIVSIFLLVEIQNSHTREIKRTSTGKKGSSSKKPVDVIPSVADSEAVDDAAKKIENSVAEPKIPQGNQQREEVKEKTTIPDETAAKQTYEETKTNVAKLLEELKAEQIKNIDIIEQHFQRAETIAETLLKNESKQWMDMWLSAKNEYDKLIMDSLQKKENAEQERETAMLAVDEQFAKVYAEIEKKKLDAEKKYKDVLEKGRAEYEKSMQAAEEKRSQAEKEFAEVGNKYKKMPMEELTKIRAKFEANMKEYEEALQMAEKKWQEVLDKTGAGKQYEEAVNKAFAELIQGQESAKSQVSKLLEESDEDLQKAEELKKKSKKQIDAYQGRAWSAYREAIQKAENERDKALQNMQKRAEMTNALADFEMNLAEVEFDKVLNKPEQEFEKITEVADKKMNETEKNIPTTETVPEKVGKGKKKKNPAPKKRQPGTTNVTQ